MQRDQEAGFTLIEALVALGILSTAAVFLLAVTQTHTTRIRDIADRGTALWVAENRLVALELGMTDLPDEVTMLGSNWHVRTARSKTADPTLERVDIRVVPGDARAQGAAALLTGFVEIRKAGGV
ncbi:type II secretion system minor pseudopilin GspI [Roseobacter sp. YSTF-M11]|uniref:Type II secretion system protein I n=1 Tax=Roseobacter insulae TaxID=2859783 RepID=A0A9X1FU39_9RHOB|nr:type II secretion system minor pseudopilin GspI [Roseobacter insulae]MBW4707432.1 type II secretion system minor pseudopilin GspI [Roseobacter insulae]